MIRFVLVFQYPSLTFQSKSAVPAKRETVALPKAAFLFTVFPYRNRGQPKPGHSWKKMAFLLISCHLLDSPKVSTARWTWTPGVPHSPKSSRLSSVTATERRVGRTWLKQMTKLFEVIDIYFIFSLQHVETVVAAVRWISWSLGTIQANVVSEFRTIQLLTLAQKGLRDSGKTSRGILPTLVFKSRRHMPEITLSFGLRGNLTPLSILCCSHGEAPCTLCVCVCRAFKSPGSRSGNPCARSTRWMSGNARTRRTIGSLQMDAKVMSCGGAGCSRTPEPWLIVRATIIKRQKPRSSWPSWSWNCSRKETDKKPHGSAAERKMRGWWRSVDLILCPLAWLQAQHGGPPKKPLMCPLSAWCSQNFWVSLFLALPRMGSIIKSMETTTQEHSGCEHLRRSKYHWRSPRRRLPEKAWSRILSR